MLFGDKVVLLKEKIAQQLFDIPIESQQLIFGSTILENHRTLFECGVFSGATIHVVLDTGGDLASVLDVCIVFLFSSSLSLTHANDVMCGSYSQAVEEALPHGFKGRFITLEECGKCPWFIGAQYDLSSTFESRERERERERAGVDVDSSVALPCRAIRSTENPEIWNLQPESVPVMGRTLDDVLPTIIATVTPPTTIQVHHNLLLDIKAPNALVRDLAAPGE